MFKIIYELCLQLVYVGVAYTTLDWFRHQKADFSAPKLTPNQCTEASQELLDGHKRELLLLKLSFLGWFLLSLVMLGLGFIWIILLQWDNG